MVKLRGSGQALFPQRADGALRAEMRLASLGSDPGKAAPLSLRVRICETRSWATVLLRSLSAPKSHTWKGVIRVTRTRCLEVTAVKGRKVLGVSLHPRLKQACPAPSEKGPRC